MLRPRVFFTAAVSRDPGDVEPGLSFGRGALTENFRESPSGGRQWGKEGIDGGVMNPCAMSVAWQLAQPSSSHTEETSVRDGRKKAQNAALTETE